MRLLLKGNIIEAKELDSLNTLEHGYLLLEDGIVKAVLPHLTEEYAGIPVDDFGDRLILQGFADLHMHAPQYPLCGLGMDLPLMDWLKKYAFPMESNFSDLGFARRVYHQLAHDFIDNGTTRVCLFSSLHTDATLVLMEELENAGLTGFVGKVNMDRTSAPNLKETTEESMSETLRWLDACHFAHVKPMITPRFTPAVSPKLMQFLGELAKERDLPVQSHLSENLTEMETVARLEPDCQQYWETYDRFGLFNSRTLMAHCVHSDEREREAMRTRGVTVVHCPDSNTGLCSGFAPIHTMLQEGIKVALGSDVAGGAILSIPGVIASAVRTSKSRRISTGWQEDFLTVPEAYYLGTSAGAAFFNAKPGFAVGEPLHAVVVDESAFPPTRNALSMQDRFERAIYLMQPKDIIAVYGNGKRLK